ncbi:MAG: hypothetical protein KME49_25095 [Brasilonema octagenarum HA4186-MV1]|nr:hypothetical protein [Brasilonema octagenarum]MBW4628699.1 hypothetical protein [Brasilonema octagenarum HA4186-MV1]
MEFIHGVRKRKYHVIVGIACTRMLVDGRCVAQLHKRGQQLYLRGLKFPVSISWYYFKRDDGKYEKRFVLSTKVLKASTISWWGKRRWQIEGWFKTAKHRRVREPALLHLPPLRTGQDSYESSGSSLGYPSLSKPKQSLTCPTYRFG